uniref:Titin n=1 Tax=Gadus morhua TaxID=8049 RepID=A0A8C5FSQ2_GADMO
MVSKSNQTVVSGLTQGEEYMFRISSTNEKGMSDPRALSMPVLAKDLVISPTFKLIFTTFSVMAGDDLKLDLPYAACPKAAVTWLKDGVALKETTRVNAEASEKNLHMIIREACREDVGTYTIKLSNTAGEATTDISVVVLDKPGPPTGPIKLDEITADSLVLSWNPPEYDGGCSINNYVVEKRDTSTTNWQIVSATVARTIIKAARLKTGSEYQFRIAAENRYGKSSVLLSETIVAQYPFEVPSQPRSAEVQSATKENMVIVWEKPSSDGGSKILGYHVELKERNSILWAKQNKQIILETRVKAAGLEEGIEYEFRVYAENIVGLSKASKVTAMQVARDPCDSPGKPEAVIVTRNQVTLKWTKPEYDGGSKVTGYVVEKKEGADGRWMKASFANVIETQFVITGLVEDQLYEFRVIARNAAGVHSKPSDSTGSITAKDEVDPPQIDLDSKYSQNVMVNAGETFRLAAGFSGKPVPSVHWMKGKQEIAEAARLEIKNTDFTACLIVKEAIRVDGGQYTLLVKNKHEYQFRVCAINKFGIGEHANAPGKILLEQKLEAPDLDLDTDMRKMINIRSASTLRLFVPVRGRPAPEVKWGKAEGEIKETAQIDNTGSYASLVIENVDRFDTGKYTLTAENPSGVKSVFISVRVLDSPSPPNNFTIKEITKNSVTLTWEPPLLDGGSKIKHYIVEKRESTRKVYSPITTCNRMSWKIEPLPEGGIFFFRVLAENEYGIGLPAKTTEPVKISEKPQPPGKVSVVDVTRKSVTLSWEKPEHDGGSRISYYDVELAPKDSYAWTVCASVKALETMVTNLQKGEEYQFRVTAVNEKGRSDSRQLAQTVVAKDLVIEPSLRPVLSSYSVQVGYDLKVEVPMSGHPKPTITWTKDGVGLKQTTRVNVTDSANHTTLTIKDATKEDGGMYSINILEDISAESITLSWEPPTYTGGCQISNYVVEKKDTTTVNWLVVSATVARTTLKVSNLKTGAEYQFRIYAENRYGKSFAIDSEPVLAQYPFQEPGPPGTPFVSSYTRDYMVRKEKNSILWTKVNKSVIQDCRYKSTPLEEGIEYEYRIYAENIVGIGKCSKVSEVCVFWTGPAHLRDRSELGMSQRRSALCLGYHPGMMAEQASPITLFRRGRQVAWHGQLSPATVELRCSKSLNYSRAMSTSSESWLSTNMVSVNP